MVMGTSTARTAKVPTEQSMCIAARRQSYCIAVSAAIPGPAKPATDKIVSKPVPNPYRMIQRNQRLMSTPLNQIKSALIRAARSAGSSLCCAG